MPERVLVVDRDVLFSNGKSYFQGFKSVDDFNFLETIRENAHFILRKVTSDEQKIPAEDDESKKQIIPYIVFKCDEKYFTYQRLRKGGEERLHDNFSIGIGGHINPIDDSNDIITDGMKREFYEEVEYLDDFEYSVIGFINDDKDSVGKVHFGIVFLVDAKSPDIKVRETDILEGSLKTLEEIDEIKDKLEGWSRIVFESFAK